MNSILKLNCKDFRRFLTLVLCHAISFTASFSCLCFSFLILLCARFTSQNLSVGNNHKWNQREQEKWQKKNCKSNKELKSCALNNFTTLDWNEKRERNTVNYAKNCCVVHISLHCSIDFVHFVNTKKRETGKSWCSHMKEI